MFIVHGRTAGGFRDSVARFIEQLGLSPVILAEQANQGRTLIEKFEAKALEVGCAIALLTPEDSAYGAGEEPPPGPNRARQNVILELGYFMASLGRKNVVALRQEGVEVPTDILGIVYIPLDDGGAWKTLLARELQAANYDIDLTGAPRLGTSERRRRTPGRVSHAGRASSDSGGSAARISAGDGWPGGSGAGDACGARRLSAASEGEPDE